MKTTKLLIIAFVFGAIAASSAIAGTVTRASVRPSFNSSRAVASHWNHNGRFRSRSNVYFGFGLGYPYFGYPYGYGYGYGYPYGVYPYGYGYYPPRTSVYVTNGITD